MKPILELNSLISALRTRLGCKERAILQALLGVQPLKPIVEELEEGRVIIS